MRQLAALLEQRRAFEADAAEDRAGLLPRRGREEDDVAVGDAEPLREPGLFRLAEKFHDRRLPLAALDLDEREAFRAQRLCGLLKSCELALRDVGEALSR